MGMEAPWLRSLYCLYLSRAWRIVRSASLSSDSRSRLTVFRTIGIAAAVNTERIVMTIIISRRVKPFRLRIADCGLRIAGGLLPSQIRNPQSAIRNSRRFILLKPAGDEPRSASCHPLIGYQ